MRLSLHMLIEIAIRGVKRAEKYQKMIRKTAFTNFIAL